MKVSPFASMVVVALATLTIGFSFGYHVAHRQTVRSIGVTATALDAAEKWEALANKWEAISEKNYETAISCLDTMERTSRSDLSLPRGIR